MCECVCVLCFVVVSGCSLWRIVIIVICQGLRFRYFTILDGISVVGRVGEVVVFGNELTWNNFQFVESRVTHYTMVVLLDWILLFLWLVWLFCIALHETHCRGENQKEIGQFFILFEVFSLDAESDRLISSWYQRITLYINLVCIRVTLIEMDFDMLISKDLVHCTGNFLV